MVIVRSNDNSLAVGMNMKRSIIHNFLLLQRSNEDLRLLQHEMENTIAYHQRRASILKAKITELSATDMTPFTRGAICLLYRLSAKVSFQVFSTTKLFSEYISMKCENDLEHYDDLDKPEWMDK